MGVGWAYCPICEKVFEGSYFPDTNVNTAEHTVERHMILRHGKKIANGRIVDAEVPNDYIRASRMRTYYTGDMQLRGDAYITCVCGRHFVVNFEEDYDDGKIIRIEVVEYDDVSRYRKISEETETIRVGHVDVHKFERIWERLWEHVKNRTVRNHLMEHGIHL